MEKLEVENKNLGLHTKKLLRTNKITKLNLSYSFITESDGQELSAALMLNHSLVELDLCGNPDIAGAIPNILIKFYGHRNLEKIDLRFCKLGDNGVLEIIKLLKQNRNIKSVAIDRWNVAPVTWELLLASITTNEEIRAGLISPGEF